MEFLAALKKAEEMGIDKNDFVQIWHREMADKERRLNTDASRLNADAPSSPAFKEKGVQVGLQSEQTDDILWNTLSAHSKLTQELKLEALELKKEVVSLSSNVTTQTNEILDKLKKEIMSMSSNLATQTNQILDAVLQNHKTMEKTAEEIQFVKSELGALKSELLSQGKEVYDKFSLEICQLKQQVQSLSNKNSDDVVIVAPTVHSECKMNTTVPIEINEIENKTEMIGGHVDRGDNLAKCNSDTTFYTGLSTEAIDLSVPGTVTLLKKLPDLADVPCEPAPDQTIKPSPLQLFFYEWELTNLPSPVYQYSEVFDPPEWPVCLRFGGWIDKTEKLRFHVFMSDKSSRTTRRLPLCLDIRLQVKNIPSTLNIWGDIILRHTTCRQVMSWEIPLVLVTYDEKRIPKDITFSSLIADSFLLFRREWYILVKVTVGISEAEPLVVPTCERDSKEVGAGKTKIVRNKTKRRNRDRKEAELRDKSSDINTSTKSHSLSDKSSDVNTSSNSHSPSDKSSDVKTSTKSHSPSDKSTDVNTSTKSYIPSDKSSDVNTSTNSHSPSDKSSDVKTSTKSHSPSDKSSDINTSTKSHSPSDKSCDVKTSTKIYSRKRSIKDVVHM